MTGSGLRIVGYAPTVKIVGTTFAQQMRTTLSGNEGTWRSYAFQRLDELIKLNEGWDGYKGFPVPFANAYFAASMLESICKPYTSPPNIVPGSAGDLQIEWHTERGDLELWIQAPYKVQAWYATHDNPDGIETELTSDFTQVVEWVRAVTEPRFAEAAAA